MNTRHVQAYLQVGEKDRKYVQVALHTIGSYRIVVGILNTEYILSL